MSITAAMSSDSVIEEDIFEEIDAESVEEDHIFNEITAKCNELDSNGSKHGAENFGFIEGSREDNSSSREKVEDSENLDVNRKKKSDHSEHIESINEDSGENIDEQRIAYSDQNQVSEDLDGEIRIEDEPKDPSNFRTDIGNKISKAVINYSGLLAENVLQEALLINEIYAKDSINVKLQECEETDRDSDIRKHLFPGQNGRVADNKGAGYDGYLLDKLLRSKADPDEIAEVNGFDGKEEHFRNKDQTYPGLDSDDAYVKAELDRIISGETIDYKIPPLLFN